MKESPQERLERLLREHRDSGKPDATDPEPPQDFKEKLQEILGSILSEIGGGDLTVAEVHVSDLRGRNRKKKDPEDDDNNELSLPLDVRPLESIRDERALAHAQAMLEQHTHAIEFMRGFDHSNPHVQFALSMGQIFGKAAMSGALLMAGHKGHGGVEQEDLQAALVGVFASVVMTALRYGQHNPEALTGADGIDPAQMSKAVEDFLDSMKNETASPDDETGTEPENKEEG